LVTGGNTSDPLERHFGSGMNGQNTNSESLAAQKYVDQIREIVMSSVNQDKTWVFVFGSRAKGTNRRTSDLDIGFCGESDFGRVRDRILDRIEEADVPLKVDLVDFGLVKETFREAAFGNGIAIWNKPNIISRNCRISDMLSKYWSSA
jgi:predicted nucleotidyltransferase